jgi:hypothetical protein
VALARAVKGAGRKILFRYGGEAVRTRMYRSFDQLVEGWTKNLVLLFPSPVFLALWRILEFALVMAGLVLLIVAIAEKSFFFAALCTVPSLITVMRISRAHFFWDANVLGVFGLPFFSYLLLRSKRAHTNGNVAWKGRRYSPPHLKRATPASPSNSSANPSENRELRT